MYSCCYPLDHVIPCCDICIIDPYSPAPAQFLNPKFHQPAHDEIDLNATFDVETPKTHKTAVAPAKKIKLDKNP